MVELFSQETPLHEILTSIKRVIAEDAKTVETPSQCAAAEPKPRKQERERQAAAHGAKEDVLEVSDAVSEEEGLASEHATAAARLSLAALEALTQAEEQRHAQLDGATLEAAVRDMLRPSLKEWVDKRLPEIVQDMVAREIVRIASKL